jgi:hypothetical protein
MDSQANGGNRTFWSSKTRKAVSIESLDACQHHLADLYWIFRYHKIQIKMIILSIQCQDVLGNCEVLADGHGSQMTMDG